MVGGPFIWQSLARFRQGKVSRTGEVQLALSPGSCAGLVVHARTHGIVKMAQMTEFDIDFDRISIPDEAITMIRQRKFRKA